AALPPHDASLHGHGHQEVRHVQLRARQRVRRLRLHPGDPQPDDAPGRPLFRGRRGREPLPGAEEGPEGRLPDGRHRVPGGHQGGRAGAGAAAGSPRRRVPAGPGVVRGHERGRPRAQPRAVRSLARQGGEHP
ncbi:hypothetical protein CRUP_010154, partial [Coryphaenoides rupestris]